MNTEKILDAIFNSYSYNRHYSHLIALCEEIKARVENNSISEWTDDGDIIYGFLVTLYGDYGTSPRSGWITEYKEFIVSCIDDIIKSLKEAGPCDI